MQSPVPVPCGQSVHDASSDPAAPGFLRAAVPTHGSEMRRGVRAPLALHDEAERGELAGAVADDLALLLLIPARAPVKFVLQRMGKRCMVFLSRLRLLCSLTSVPTPQLCSTRIPCCASIQDSIRRLQADLQQHCLEAREGCADAQVDFLAGVHGLGGVLVRQPQGLHRPLQLPPHQRGEFGTLDEQPGVGPAADIDHLRSYRCSWEPEQTLYRPRATAGARSKCHLI